MRQVRLKVGKDYLFYIRLLCIDIKKSREQNLISTPMDGNEQKYIQEALTLIDCANRDKPNYF
jgi:hypothetical protein